MEMERSCVRGGKMEDMERDEASVGREWEFHSSEFSKRTVLGKEQVQGVLMAVSQ